eukprot:CAMPEP_0182817960 /NCGR_PEP_ID=MMETSP0006_2-20121128/11758_1 /TAXON_ID=97485 /ORGANISM="Prymnesium parvum, Strain Texoma1" /LENGTH=46 /DNA_ID= /DNA_START= /DNA_END= /DNA_ORIENTATION=
MGSYHDELAGKAFHLMGNTTERVAVLTCVCGKTNQKKHATARSDEV